jgi:hypothetical protein
MQRLMRKAVFNGWLPEFIEAPDGKRVPLSSDTLIDVLSIRSIAEAVFGKDLVCMRCGKSEFPYEKESCCEIDGMTPVGYVWNFHLTKLALMPEEERYKYLERFLD